MFTSLARISNENKKMRVAHGRPQLCLGIKPYFSDSETAGLIQLPKFIHQGVVEQLDWEAEAICACPTQVNKAELTEAKVGSRGSTDVKTVRGYIRSENSYPNSIRILCISKDMSWSTIHCLSQTVVDIDGLSWIERPVNMLTPLSQQREYSVPVTTIKIPVLDVWCCYVVKFEC